MGALPAGSTVRFRVRDTDERSGSSWSIETARHSGDVYLAHREGARWVKTSFHESGQWHYSVTQAGLSLDPDVPAYLGVIKEHSEIAPGWLHATRITVDRAELRAEWIEQVRDRRVVDVLADTSFDAVSIDVLLGAAGAATIRIDHAFLVGDLARGDDGSAVVVARPMNIDAPVRVALAPQVHEATESLRAYGWDGSTASRLVIFGGDADGYLRQVEVAVDPE
jgi:hypothetical protein